MLDEKITGSYLRDLEWTSETPQENDRARQELFAEIKSRSLIAQRVKLEHAELELGLVPEDDHLLVWYQILELDGEWPGGDYVLESLQLVFNPGNLGGRMDIAVLPSPCHGFTAWKRKWGCGFPRQPLVRRFPLPRGEYEFSVKVHGTYRQQPTGEEEVMVGPVTIPPGHCFVGYGAANDLMVRWADYDLYAVHPSPPAKADVTPPDWMEPYFAALDEAIEWVREWHHCPRSTSNWYHERTPAEGYGWNDRYRGFYLNAFVPAYLLTGERRYFQMCEYLYNNILDNIVPGFWGGPTINQASWDTGDNLLHNGILARAVMRFARMMGDNELTRPMYEIFASWPRDRKRDDILINVVFPDLSEQRIPFVYNQVMSSVAAAWPLGHLFDNQGLLEVSERMWQDIMRPGFQEEGFWFYVEGQPVVTQHYDLVQKHDASLWLEYDRWAQDEDFREVMRRSMDFSIKYCTEEVENMLVWHPFYAGKFESTLAVGKAGMALEALTRLCQVGFEEFAEPAAKTARFINYMREKPDLQDMWPCSWMSCHVIGPLLEATLAGLVEM